MQKLFAFVFATLLLVLLSCTTTTNADWEGVYYTVNSTVLYVCQNGTAISGRNEYGLFFATTTAANTSIAFGKYFLLGDTYTGITRLSYKKFTGGRGNLGLILDDTTNELRGYMMPQGSTNFSLATLLFFLPQNTTDVGDDRVLNCGILDRTSSKTVAGHWNTTAKSEVDANLCLTTNAKGRTNAVLTGSYSFLYNFDYAKETLPGYLTGYCAAHGQVCGTIFYQNDLDYTSYTSFGAELIFRLSDDRLIIVHTRGAPGITGFTTYNIGINPLVRKGTASTKKCAQFSSSFFDPTACADMSKKFCKEVTEYGFCHVVDEVNACRRIQFP